MLTYAQAQEKFARCKDPNKGYNLGSSTVLLKQEEFYVVRFHQTDIVTLTESGSYAIKIGGWYSRTTKEGIEQYSPVRIATERGIWFTRDNNRVVPITSFVYDSNKEYEYFAANPISLEMALANNRVFTRENAKYRKAYVKKFLDGSLGTPNGGDCWLCHNMRSNELGKAVTIGECHHLWAHFAEPYHVPTLLYAALMERYMATSFSEKPPVDIAAAAQEDWRRAWSMANGGWIDRVLRRFFHRRRMAMVQLYTKEMFEEFRTGG